MWNKNVYYDMLSLFSEIRISMEQKGMTFDHNFYVVVGNLLLLLFICFKGSFKFLTFQKYFFINENKF